MPTPTKGPRLGGSPAHERLILANLAQSLFEHGKITTTEAKAKKLRPFAEKLITSAKRGTLHSRREVLKTIQNKDVLHKLFAEIGPSFATRDGGYTRIIKTAPRKGDNAPMALIELITEETVTATASRTTRRAARTRAAQPAATAAPAVAAAAAPAESDVAEEETPTQAEQAATEDAVEGAPEGAAEAAAPAESDVAEEETPTQAEQAATEDAVEGAPGAADETDAK